MSDSKSEPTAPSVERIKQVGRKLNSLARLVEIDATVAVLGEISDERVRQDAKWGEQNHEPFAWLAILGEEVGEANQAALEAHFDKDATKLSKYRAELVQVAAVAVAMIESLDRNRK